MTETAQKPALAPDAAAKLTEFARSCRAAARAVSLYPAAHPAIAASLGRLAQITTRITDKGPFQLRVQPHDLQLDGGSVPRPDPAISELAAVLHGHFIGELTITSGAGAESWRTLLLLLARPSEEVRADGGIARLWATAGGPSLEIQEIDYAEILREKQGQAGVMDLAVAAALAAGPDLQLDDGAMRALVDIIGSPSSLDELMGKLEESAKTVGVDPMAAAFLRLLKGLTDYLGRTTPDAVNTMFEQMGRAAGRLSAEAMLQILGQRHAPEAMAGQVDVVGGMAGHMSDQSVAQFVAGSVVAEGGATDRLAHAFQALVPDRDRQRQLLSLAEERVAASELGQEQSFTELWGKVEGMLASYSDADFVSTQYGRELSNARTRALDVEQTSDDPPERITAWLSTIADGALRALDNQLLVDLLAIEPEPARWRDIAETVVTHAADLVRVGYFEQAWTLAEAVVAGSSGEEHKARLPHARSALAQFGSAALMKHIAVHLRDASDESVERFARLCHATGPPAIAPLAETLSTEQDARARRRLRDILLGFGAQGRESFRQLMNAPNWEVRRTAAFLLREFGGNEGLRELIPLLSDPEPLVQREAIQGLVLNGSAAAAEILLKALGTAAGRTKETLVSELATVRNDRAAPLFGYLVKHMPRQMLPDVYVTAIESLGTFGGPGAVDALTHALQQAEFWSPIRTKRIRTAAAGALRRMGTPEARGALEAAAASGPRGARAAARAALDEQS